MQRFNRQQGRGYCFLTPLYLLPSLTLSLILLLPISHSKKIYARNSKKNQRRKFSFRGRWAGKIPRPPADGEREEPRFRVNSSPSCHSPSTYFVPGTVKKHLPCTASNLHKALQYLPYIFSASQQICNQGDFYLPGAISGNISGVTSGGLLLHLMVRDAAKHPTMYRAAPTIKNLAQTSIMPRLRNSVLQRRKSRLKVTRQIQDSQPGLLDSNACACHPTLT